MGGLFVLFLLAIYIWGAYKIVRWIKPVWGKTLVVVAILLIPTADAVYGRIKLKHICETEGGLKVYKTVEGVEGFFIDRLGATPEWITKYGYRFVESKGVGGRPMRLSREQDGRIVAEENIVPRSKYRYEYSGTNFDIGYARGEKRIRDLQTNEIFARYVDFSYEGGWAERLVGRISDAGSGFVGNCQYGADTISLYQFVSETLKPAN